MEGSLFPRRAAAFVAVALGLVSLPAWAGTINVPADQATIQAAINAAANGDTVLVAPGTYDEQLDFLGKAITVMSSGGAAVTILDGGGTHRIVTFETHEGNGSVLQGFTLTHAYVSDVGSAIYLLSTSPTIADNVFVYNQGADGYFGAAIGGYGAPVILRNFFADNTCGLQANSSVVAILSGAAGVIADNVFADNPCPALDVSLRSTTTVKIYNNTIVGNRAGLIVSSYGTNATTFFSNNLIAFNQYGVQVTLVNGGTFPTWSHNLVYGDIFADYQGIADQTGTDSNISTDPVLKYWHSGDVHLLSSSPAIDAGDNTVSQASATDFYGDARVYAGIPGDMAIVDIGAAESITPDDVPGVPNVINVPADYSTIQAGIDAASVGDEVVVAPGTYYEKPSFKGKSITVKSSGGPSVTILDGNNSGPIVSFVLEGFTTILQGFTFTHAKAESGGAAINISGPAAPTIQDNVFLHNVAYGAPAIGMFGGAGAPVILHNYFADNFCSNSIDDPRQSVMEFQGDSPVIADNVIVNNPCPAILVPAGTVYNNTIVGNNAGVLFYGGNNAAATSFSNNLIAFNNYGVNADFFNGGKLPAWSHNLVYGNATADYQGVANQTGTNGNISSDPVLKYWLGGDVHLLYGSPAIDVGDSTMSQVSPTDFYDKIRIFAGMPGDAEVIDIGAAEYEPPFVSAPDGSIMVALNTARNSNLSFANADSTEPLTFALVTLPAHGTVTLTNADTGAFQYVPAQDYLGADSFTFRITDPYGTVSNTATEHVSVTRPPATANNGNVNTTPEITAHGALSATQGFTGQMFSFSLVSKPQHGTVNLSPGNGQFSYAPVQGYAGADSFTFEVTDTFGVTSNVATESVTVTDIAAKLSSTKIMVFPRRGPGVGVLTAVKAYIGQVLSFSVVTPPAHGNAVITNSSTGAFRYTANSNYQGKDSFTFKATDQWGTSSNIATVTVVVY